MTKRELGLMCNCAIRYALGRSTYIVGAVTDFVKNNKDEIDDKSLVVIKNDVEYAIERNDTGDPNIDLPVWASFLTFIKEELNNRGFLE